MKKSVFGLTTLFLAGVFIWFFFFFNNVVTEGSAYGFTIGMPKEEAVDVIKEQYATSKNIIVLSSSLHEGDSEFTTYISAEKISNETVTHNDVWQLRFGGKETNVLILVFGDSKLETLHRYRRAFIL